MDPYQHSSEVAARVAYREFVRPRVAELLGAAELDVVYHRAEGSYLWYRDAAGEERRVLDLVGGFGASLFGHNPPALVDCLQSQLDRKRPFNAQASVRGCAALLAQRLSELVGRATGRRYVTTFCSSGAEAVEAALKHAEMEAWQKRTRMLRDQKRIAGQVRQALRLGAPIFDDETAARVPRQRAALESLLDDSLARASAALAQPAAILALEGAFHGKTSGALRLTHNALFRQPWERWGHAVFLPAQDLEALRDAIELHTSTLNLLAQDGAGKVRWVPTRFAHVLAVFCEPIQGEGGVRELSPEYLAELRRSADEHGFPLVFDEIQSGMGRTGRFLASEWSGVRGDYYLLSKSLGGGLTKIAALLVDQRRYVHDFGYLHTSTFAEDDHSCAVALAALDLLARGGGALLEACRAKGEHLLGALRALAREFPDQIRDVRGRGLLIGIELRQQTPSPSTLIRVLSEQRLSSFFLAGYLLREHAIRVAPALSEHATLRIEPPAEIALEELDRLLAALRDALVLLRAADVRALAGLAAHESGSARAQQVVGVDQEQPAALSSPRRVAFLAHLRDARDLRLLEPALASSSDRECAELLSRIARVISPFLLGMESIRSVLGHSVELAVIAVPFTAAHALDAVRGQDGGWALRQVQAAVDLAADLGCSLVGCGGYTSIVSENCQALSGERLGVTSGNSLTAAAAAEALLGAAQRRGIEPRVLGVVGAAGNIGAMLAELTSERAERIVLVGRPGAAARLRRVAERLGRPATIATDLSALRECSVIVSASNSVAPIVGPEHIGAQPVVICDAAVPRDVSPRVPVECRNALLIRGGSLRLPLGQELRVQGVSVAPGNVYACLAEVALLGLSELEGSFSHGGLRREQVHLIRALARLHGFGVEETLDSEAAWRGLDG